MEVEHKAFAVDLKADDSGEPGSFTGYASVFNNVDSYGDVMVKGAFADSIAERGLPLVSWEHAWEALGPIGELTAAKEDDHGLKVEGKLYVDDPLVGRIHRSMKAGGVKDMSFAFMVKDADPIDEKNKKDFPAGATRAVKAVEWLETGIVVKGANAEAGLVSVRSVGDDEAFEKRLEEVLQRRDAEEKARAEEEAAEAERIAHLNSLADVEPWELGA